MGACRLILSATEYREGPVQQELSASRNAFGQRESTCQLINDGILL
jgi:hypothetical protein